MILVKNVYYMLCYAFSVLNEQGYKSVETEEFDNIKELMAAILEKGITVLVKRGLKKEYVLCKNSLSTLRGKIEITDSIKSQTTLKRQMICSFDEFSKDSLFNRVIKSVAEILIKSDIKKERKIELKKLMMHFNDVKIINLKNINWNFRYDRNNQHYRLLISICYLVVKGLLQTNFDGKIKLMDFLDDRKMSRLYEKFILEYYKKHFSKIKVSSSEIKWQLDDNNDFMLPKMQSDVMLSYDNKILIIDAKYYSKVTQSHFNTHTLHSNNLYQIFTYVKNQDIERNGNVFGMLLYAKTDELILPNNDYLMSGNKISVKTLDLNCDFALIQVQLDKIVFEYFGLVKDK